MLGKHLGLVIIITDVDDLSDCQNLYESSTWPHKDCFTSLICLLDFSFAVRTLALSNLALALTRVHKKYSGKFSASTGPWMPVHPTPSTIVCILGARSILGLLPLSTCPLLLYLLPLTALPTLSGHFLLCHPASSSLWPHLQSVPVQ